MSELRIVGQRVPRVDAPDKVTGRAGYAADYTLPDTLHGAVLRSPHAHARIKRIDTSRAERAPGVAAVVTREDIWKALGLTQEQAQLQRPSAQFQFLAWDKAVYAGQPVAAVAAVTREAAQEALGLIQVDYEVQPPVMDADAAMKPESPPIHPSLAGRGQASANVTGRNVVTLGDVGQGFAQADVTLEETFRSQIVHQGYMEPHAVTATVDAMGKITMWTTAQGSFNARADVCRSLNIPQSRMKVIVAEVGGGFGGKNDPVPEPICVLLALKAKKPVKLVMSREEEFIGAKPAHGVDYRLKMGATRDGRVTAASATVVFDTGAFGGEMPPSAVDSVALYNIPNLSLEHFQVVTNTPPNGAYRAPGHPQMAFAVESMLDMLAQSIGMDPLELRLKNAVQEGDKTPDGNALPRIGFKETLERVKRHPIWSSPLKEGRGRGIACGLWNPAGMTSNAQVQVNTDGTIALMTGSVDLTGTRTTLSQIVAQEFGVDMSQVSVVVGDTDTAVYSDLTGGSRTARATGNAVLKACEDAIGQLKVKAAAQLKCRPEEVEYGQRKLWKRGEPQNVITAADIARRCFFGRDDAIIGRGQSVRLPRSQAYAVHVAEVEVDRETGQVTLASYLAAQDVGFALNPTLVEGQLQGSAVQGIGWALSEGYSYKDGVMLNPNFLDYRMPTAADLPAVETILVEVPDPSGPYGLRGVGEPPIIPPLAAVANAIQRACGARLTKTPMTPEAVWRGMRKGA